MRPGLLVIAKAPVPGLAKTRIAVGVGAVAAADLAAAALLDTLDVGEQWADEERRLIALTGDLTCARRGDEIADRLRRWTVVSQHEGTFAQRLLHAHHDAETVWGANEVLVQIGTDTPQLTPTDLDAVVKPLHPSPLSVVDAVVGPAIDGGWWALATRRAGYVEGLVDVPMSTSHTCADTAAMLRTAGARVHQAHCLSDVDTLADAQRVALHAPETRFAASVNALFAEAAR